MNDVINHPFLVLWLRRGILSARYLGKLRNPGKGSPYEEASLVQSNTSGDTAQEIENW